MKLTKILISFLALFFSFFILNTSNAAINMTISPIKYELESATWATITREAKLTNHTDGVIHIVTWKSDFVANWENWVPRFIRKSEVVFNQELSDWITIDTPSFDISPNETKVINFTINIPDNATPGWHYWAVFFKNWNSEQSSGANVWINVDYWILILLNIDWDINSEIEIWEPIIWGNSWNVKHMDICNQTWWDKSWDYYDWKCLIEDNQNSNTWTTSSWEIIEDIKEDIDKETTIEYKKEDDCSIDLTNSNFDWKCINNLDEIVAELTWNIEEENLDTDNIDDKNDTEKTDSFEITIEIPIENKWNTHVKPSWKITLIDENWNELKKIWKEVVTNDKWAIIGEKIVDYLPINDIWWNILPDTKRVYRSDWKWFPFETRDEEWKIIIDYKTPSEYYTDQNLNEQKFIMPWERICSKVQNKKITAKFNINYSDEHWDNIEYNSAEDFNVEYIEEYVWLNPYFFIILWLFWLLFLFIFLLLRKKKKVCINDKCKRKINSDIKICPYCGKDQSPHSISPKGREVATDSWNKKNKSNKKTGDERPILLATKKQKLKTKKLELKESIKTILIENKLKFAEDLTKLTPKEILEIKWIWVKAIDEIKKALKKEKMKLKK